MVYLVESLFFWLSWAVLIFGIVLFFRHYRKAYDYEMQVNQGWSDMVHRAERLLLRLEEIHDELHKIKKDREESVKKMEEIKEIVLKKFPESKN